MAKDWKDLTDDELLNFDDAHTATMSRYERIMQKRSIDALAGLRDKLVGLMETIYRASQGLQDRADKSLESLTCLGDKLTGLIATIANASEAFQERAEKLQEANKQSSKAQWRQQNVLSLAQRRHRSIDRYVYLDHLGIGCRHARSE